MVKHRGSHDKGSLLCEFQWVTRVIENNHSQYFNKNTEHFDP